MRKDSREADAEASENGAELLRYISRPSIGCLLPVCPSLNLIAVSCFLPTTFYLPELHWGIPGLAIVGRPQLESSITG